MTSLAHFEKVARAIETPHLAVIDGRLQPSVTARAVRQCDAAQRHGDQPRCRMRRGFNNAGLLAATTFGASSIGLRDVLI